MAMRLRVVTLNLRNVSDRWDERRPLLLAEFGALAPDLAGLQEVVFADERQHERLAAAVPARSYATFAAPARYPEFGNALLVGAGAADGHEIVALGHGRVAQRVRVRLPGGTTLCLANTHLHHTPGDADVRADQVGALCEWLAAAPPADATIVVGDFNTAPVEPGYPAMVRAGWRSAYREAHGAEPAVTWPSGIQAPTIDVEGPAACLDYVWVRGAVRVAGARLACDAPAPHDPTLYPSDHFAVVAEVDVP
jgi:endonuclease/exonuclease/phosphatase family metal-dependent hydrolase